VGKHGFDPRAAVKIPGALRQNPDPSAVVQVIPLFALHRGGQIAVYQKVGPAPGAPAFHARALRGLYGLCCAARRLGESVRSRRAGDGG
jgi:hypothetical protein